MLLFSLGAAALALPLWVHLRQGRTRRRAKVSSLHLLLAAPQSSRQPKRLVNLPLFFLRCLLVLLLALAFGRWLVPLFGGGTRQAYAVVVVDISASMQAVHGGEPVWNEARDRAMETLEGLGSDSRVALMPSPSGGVRPAWESPTEARRRLKAMRPGFGENHLVDDLRASVRLLETMPGDRAKLLHVVSDIQRSSLAGLDQLTIPAGIEVRAVKAGPLTAPNRGVAIEVMAAGAMDIGFYGFSDGSGGEMRIEENGRTTPWMVTPGRAETRLAPYAADGAWVTRKLGFDADEAIDAIAQDNMGYDSFPNPAVIPVWLIEPEPRDGHTAIYQQAGYFVRIALQPVLENDAFRASRYEPRVVNVGEVPTVKSGELPRLLVIPALPALPNEVADLAKAVVADGGAVVFFTGPDLAVAEYTQKLGDLLPASIGAEVNFAQGQSLEPITDRHPLWGGLDTQTRRELARIGLRVGHSIEAGDGARVLAYDAAARPFIVERRFRQGGTYFVNTSSDRAWGDWAAKSALFVPALHQLCARALGVDAFEARHAPWTTGESSTLSLGRQHAGVSVTIAGQKHQTDDRGDVKAVVFEKPGVFDVTAAHNTLIQRVAVNFPTSESTLDALPEAVMTQRLAALRQGGTQRAQRWADDSQAGSIAWKICLALVALLLLIEPLLIHRPRK
jgi:hypothetical protein